MIPQEIAERIGKHLPDAVLEAKTEGVIDPSLRIAPDRMRAVSLFLRDDEAMLFDSLMCLSGVDHGNGSLGVTYHLHSMKHNHKVVLKTEMPITNPRCASVEAVWKTANWHEREAYDLFGIIFEGHPDLRRILLPDDWVGYPLRKDYKIPEYYRGMKVPY